MRDWPLRRWVAAGIAAVATAILIAVPTAMIKTPVFGRSVPVTWWAWPVLAVTAALSGLVMATYIAVPEGARPPKPRDSRLGVFGGMLSMLAVGCPACNKIALLALGASGAVTWFAPFQPLLAAGSIVLLVWALRRRLAGERGCTVPGRTGGAADTGAVPVPGAADLIAHGPAMPDLLGAGPGGTTARRASDAGTAPAPGAGAA